MYTISSATYLTQEAVEAGEYYGMKLLAQTIPEMFRALEKYKHSDINFSSVRCEYTFNEEKNRHELVTTIEVEG